TEQGIWFHGIYYASTVDPSQGQPIIPLKCATDFSAANTVRIQYRQFDDIDRQDFSSILQLPDGYTELARNATSGAVDYIRSPLFTLGCADELVAIFVALAGGGPWIEADGAEAEPILQTELNQPLTR